MLRVLAISLTTIFLSMLLSACQWVKPTEGADKVALVKPAHIATCKKLGSTRSKVKDSVGFVDRKEKKVSEELVLLGKNAAVDMGGDTIVAVGEMAEGSQQFDVYNCQ